MDGLELRVRESRFHQQWHCARRMEELLEIVEARHQRVRRRRYKASVAQATPAAMIITGSSKGLGLALAEAVLELGDDVCITSRDASSHSTPIAVADDDIDATLAMIDCGVLNIQMAGLMKSMRISYAATIEKHRAMVCRRFMLLVITQQSFQTA